MSLENQMNGIADRAEALDALAHERRLTPEENAEYERLAAEYDDLWNLSALAHVGGNHAGRR